MNKSTLLHPIGSVLLSGIPPRRLPAFLSIGAVGWKETRKPTVDFCRPICYTDERSLAFVSDQKSIPQPWQRNRKEETGVKRKTHRLLALALAAVLLLGAFPTSNAVPDVIFTAINDTFLRNLAPNTMPMQIDGLVYVPYSTFLIAPSPGLSSTYNAANNQLVLYNINRILTFDMANAITYDEQGTVYGANAVRRNGTYYVPARVVCDAFGFYFSFVPGNLLGPIVRINTDDNMVSDDYLVSRSFTVMRSIYDQYQREYGGETEEPDPDNETNGNSSTPPPSTNENPNASGEPVEEDPEAKPVVYLAFEGDLNDSTGQILDILQESGYQATFFVTGRLHAGNVEYLARAAAAGHTIGNNLDGYAGVGAGFQDLAQEAAATTEAVQAVIKTRPRLLMVPGGSASLTQEEVDALVESGYRLWDGSFETQAQTAGAIYSACLSHLEGASGHVVLNLRSSPENAEALSSLVDYFRSNGYEVRPITDVVASINQILDKR